MSNYPLNDYRDYLEHSAKGQKWSNHKYLYITPSGRYVYPEDGIRMQNLRGYARNVSAAKNKNLQAQRQFANTHRGHDRKTDYENIYNVYEYKKPVKLKSIVGNSGVFTGRGVKNFKKSLDMNRTMNLNVNDLKINGKKQRVPRRPDYSYIKTGSRRSSFIDRIESALYTDLKNSARKLYESGSSSNASIRKRPAKRSIFARYFDRKRFGGRTSTRTGRGGSYSSSSKKF